jgi:hypothetical protein
MYITNVSHGFVTLSDFQNLRKTTHGFVLRVSARFARYAEKISPRIRNAYPKSRSWRYPPHRKQAQIPRPHLAGQRLPFMANPEPAVAIWQLVASFWG